MFKVAVTVTSTKLFIIDSQRNCLSKTLKKLLIITFQKNIPLQN